MKPGYDDGIIVRVRVRWNNFGFRLGIDKNPTSEQNVAIGLPGPTDGELVGGYGR